MINGVELANFKCFESLQLSLRPLTVLSGFNAAGKSSAVQGLLLIAQALKADASSPFVPLNGSYVELGTPGDVVRDGGKGGPQLDIGFSSGSRILRWSLIAEDRTAGLALRSKSLAVFKDENIENEPYATLASLEADSRLHEDVRSGVESLKQMVAISAVRPVVNDVFPFPQGRMPTFANVGTNGQFAPWWFNYLSDEEIEEDRCHPSDSAKVLRRQFAAWAGTLFPGAQANVQHLTRTNLTRLELRIGDTDEWRRPANIGYGLSYAFPILVAALIAKRDQVLYIDSPEAHLHPAAQSAMGRFLAYMAQSGVQLIVETHSDHVVNGVRLAVREGKVSSASVIFQFFSHSPLPSKRTVEPITIDSSGQTTAWPNGFFDQIEKDLALL
jgi:predicted ATPase